MSVPAYERTVSSVEFLKTARDIEVNLIKLIVEKPKRYRFFYQRLIDISIEILNKVKKGNSIYVETKAEAELRMRYFKIAIANLQALVSQIEILYHIFKDDGIKIEAVKLLSNDISREIALLQGALKNCRLKYKNLLQSK